jgi:MFS family permease
MVQGLYPLCNIVRYPRSDPLLDDIYDGMTRYTMFTLHMLTRNPQGISQMQSEFHIKEEPIVVLGVTTYLAGIAVGSLLLAPLSETYGRKWVYCINMAVFVLLVLPCAKATSIAVSSFLQLTQDRSINLYRVNISSV